MTAPPSLRKVLVLVNNHFSTRAAVNWAAHWAVRTGDEVALLHVIEPEGMLNIGMIQDMVRAEAWAEAERLLGTFAPLAEKLTGRPPVHIIREGPLKETVRTVIKEEEDKLSMLVVAASHREKGPAPLIGYLASRMGSRVQVPLVLVPGSLTAEKIDEIC